MSRVKAISTYFIGIPLFVPGGSHMVSEQGVFGELGEWRYCRGRQRELLDHQVCGHSERAAALLEPVYPPNPVCFWDSRSQHMAPSSIRSGKP